MALTMDSVGGAPHNRQHDQKGGPFAFEGDPTKKSWIEIEMVDQHNKPVPHLRYRVVPPGADVKPIEGFLDTDGYAKVTGRFRRPRISTKTFPSAQSHSRSIRTKRC
jgi:hypothetical protein